MVYMPKYDYILSAKLKGSVKKSIFLQFLLALLIETQIGLHFIRKVYQVSHLTYDDTYSFELPEVPNPQVWQYVWLTSLLPCIFGCMAMKKDKVWFMRVYYYGSICLGIATCLFTVALNASHFYTFTQTKSSTYLFQGIPVILIWYFYLILLIQVHVYGVYNGGKLINIWSNDLNKIKKKI